MNCMFDESGNCVAQGGGGGTTFGNDIFDAVMGTPGTYLTFDLYGRMGFGFDYGLWSATMNFIDNVRADPAIPGCQTNPRDPACSPDQVAAFSPPVGSFTVIAHDYGAQSTVQGFIPDLINLQEEQARVGNALSKVSLAGTQFAPAGNLLNLFMINSPKAWQEIADWALAQFPDASSDIKAMISLGPQLADFVDHVADIFPQ